MADDTPNVADVAIAHLASEVNALGLTSHHLSSGVHDSTDDLVASLDDIVTAGRLLEEQRAELRQTADLRMPAGQVRLEREANERAQSISEQAGVDFDRNLAALREFLVEDAQPRLGAGRESYGREELRVAFDGVQGEAAERVARQIALHGSHEAAATLLTPFARTLLVAKGVTNVDALLREVRSLNVTAAPQRATTERERIAAQALHGDLAGLGASKGAAGAYVLRLLRG